MCPRRHFAVAQVLVIRSRPQVTSTLDRKLIDRKFSPLIMSGNRDTVTLTGSDSFSLVLLSLNLPSRDNLVILQAIHSHNTALPVVVLAICSSLHRGIRNLGDNTSSCIAGPFRLTRLVTHVRIRLHGGATLPTPRSLIFAMKRLRLSLHRHRIGQSNGIMRLSAHRFVLLRVLVHHRNRTIDQISLVGRI